MLKFSLACISACLLLPQLSAGGSGATNDPKRQEAQDLKACAEMVLAGLRNIADSREKRFEGKVPEAAALCRGGQKTLQFRLTPWVDWSNYWGTGDMAFAAHRLSVHKRPGISRCLRRFARSGVSSAWN